MISNKKTRNIIISFISILMLMLSCIPVFAETSDPEVLNQARNYIKNYYVDEVPDSILNMTSIEDMVKALNDPYSAYFTPQKYNDFINSINNQFSGIGIQIEEIPEGLKIVKVFDGSPAIASGIKEGDIITEADGHPLAGVANEVAVTYIRGKEGTTVDLKVKRGEDILSFTVIRKNITLPTVTANILDDHIAYIDLSTFGENTANEFSDKLTEMEAKNPDYYVIDLRNNGGGYLETARNIAGYFIGGNPVLKIQGRNDPLQVYDAVDHGKSIDKLIIFLINQYSASASEILSAAVKDYKKAYFIGQTTYGKGVAQNIYPLNDGSSIKLTVERFYSPLGNVIQKKGVSPDLTVENKDIDSLKVTQLLLGSEPSGNDKTGFLKTTISGKEFVIDMNKAKDSKYADTFSYMLDNIIPSDNLYTGTASGWEKADSTQKIKNTLFPTISVKISASETQQKLLPQTGSGIDVKTMIIFGSGIAMIGAVVLLSGKLKHKTI